MINEKEGDFWQSVLDLVKENRELKMQIEMLETEIVYLTSVLEEYLPLDKPHY